MSANLVANVTVTGNLSVATTITVDTQSSGGFSVVNPNFFISNVGTGSSTQTSVVLKDGTVRVCGNNGFGQLGQNDTITRSTLVPVLGISSQAITIASGVSHTVILMNDGTVRVCGRNVEGQLGQNSGAAKSTSVPVLGISSQAVAIAAGGYHTAILMNDGTVRICGSNNRGQLGQNDLTNRLTVVSVLGISSQAIAVACGQFHTAILINDGTVRVCGDNAFGQLCQNDIQTTRSTVVSVLGISSQAIAVACGAYHTAILMNDGTVRVCGYGNAGGLGQNVSANRSTPVPVIGISSQAIGIACGNQHTAILMNDGTVRICGRNSEGQLGQNDLINRLTVVSVLGISSQAIAVGAGTFHSVFLMNDGSVRVCGNNPFGQLGQNDVVTRSTVVSVVAPSNQKCYTSGPNGAKPIGINTSTSDTGFVMNDGTVRVCGRNDQGQLGQNNSVDSSTIVSVIGISQAIGVAYGVRHLVILMNDGTVRVCGYNNRGQLGQNNGLNKSTPVPVLGISSQAIAVACGNYVTAILMNNGTVRMCGDNSQGQLGLNDLTNRSTPVPVIGISSQAIAVSCSSNYNAILMNDGTVRVCGANNLGQLGQNDLTTRSTVVSVLGISSQAIAIACGGAHLAILMNDGTVRVCGYNASGQLGQNDKINRSTVVSVLGISSQAIAVACGRDFTAILMNDGTVRVCGLNNFGQLGQNDLTTRSTVVSVLGISSQAIAVACGQYYTAILMNDGSVRVCGRNDFGQLGLNDVVTRSTVVSVPGLSGPILNMGSLLLGLNPTPGTAQTYQLDLSTDNARKATTTTWATGSDMRIKSDIQSANLARCSEIIDSLDLKYFSWTPNINTEDRHSLGWIAQEVEQYFPKSIVTSEAHGIPDFKNLNSDQLIKAMYGALKNMIQQTYPPTEAADASNTQV